MIRPDLVNRDPVAVTLQQLVVPSVVLWRARLQDVDAALNLCNGQAVTGSLLTMTWSLRLDW